MADSTALPSRRPTNELVSAVDDVDARTPIPTNSVPTTKHDYIVMTPYPIEPGHTLISVNRIRAADWKAEYRANATYVAEGDNAGIIINRAASIMDYNRTQNSHKDSKKQPMSAKMSFKVSLINSESGKVSLEHRTLRFWLESNQQQQQQSQHHSRQTSNNFETSNHRTSDANDSNADLNRSFSHFKTECSNMAQSYFCLLVGSKPDDDFPKNYVAFIMKLMRLLRNEQFRKIYKMEVEVRQLAPEEKPPSRSCKYSCSIRHVSQSYSTSIPPSLRPIVIQLALPLSLPAYRIETE